MNRAAIGMLSSTSTPRTSLQAAHARLVPFKRTTQENYADIEKYDAVIVGVSADSSESHGSFRERYGLGFPLVADPGKNIIRAYGAESLFGLTARVTYVIDKAGIIQSVIRHDLAIGKHLPDVLGALEQIQSSFTGT